jgi:triosephosphate isomerase
VTRPLIGTSWKMNLTSTQAASWFGTARPRLEPLAAERDLFVLPPFPAIWVAREALGGGRIAWGGQDVHPDDDGAHTGDVSAPMLVDLGCRYVEIGHSERRRDHGEADGLVAAKVRAALRWRLMPIVCVGEPEHGPVAKAWSVVAGQLDGAFDGLVADDLDRLVIAYEPVWAIGEGAAAADGAHVGRIHLAIAAWLADRGATAPRVIYGGSVDETSAAELGEVDGVGGLFVGRAALDPIRFAEIAATPFPRLRAVPPPLERSA